MNLKSKGDLFAFLKWRGQAKIIDLQHIRALRWSPLFHRIKPSRSNFLSPHPRRTESGVECWKRILGLWADLTLLTLVHGLSRDSGHSEQGSQGPPGRSGRRGHACPGLVQRGSDHPRACVWIHFCSQVLGFVLGLFAVPAFQGSS